MKNNFERPSTSRKAAVNKIDTLKRKVADSDIEDSSFAEIEKDLHMKKAEQEIDLKQSADAFVTNPNAWNETSEMYERSVEVKMRKAINDGDTELVAKLAAKLAEHKKQRTNQDSEYVKKVIDSLDMKEISNSKESYSSALAEKLKKGLSQEDIQPESTKNIGDFTDIESEQKNPEEETNIQKLTEQGEIINVIDNIFQTGKMPFSENIQSPDGAGKFTVNNTQTQWRKSASSENVTLETLNQKNRVHESKKEDASEVDPETKKGIDDSPETSLGDNLNFSDMEDLDKVWETKNEIQSELREKAAEQIQKNPENAEQINNNLAKDIEKINQEAKTQEKIILGQSAEKGVVDGPSEILPAKYPLKDQRKSISSGIEQEDDVEEGIYKIYSKEDREKIVNNIVESLEEIADMNTLKKESDGINTFLEQRKERDLELAVTDEAKGNIKKEYEQIFEEIKTQLHEKKESLGELNDLEKALAAAGDEKEAKQIVKKHFRKNSKLGKFSKRMQEKSINTGRLTVKGLGFAAVGLGAGWLAFMAAPFYGWYKIAWKSEWDKSNKGGKK